VLNPHAIRNALSETLLVNDIKHVLSDRGYERPIGMDQE